MGRIIMANITAQELLNGPGFDDKHMLDKAYRELERVRSCSHTLIIYDHLINFSITVALIADWTFHLRLAGTPKWNNKTEIHFCNWIRSQSPEVATFIDISNECKHANRKHQNFLAEKVLLCPIWDTSTVPAEQLNVLEQNGFRAATRNGDNMDSTVLIVPVIKYDSKQEYFYDVAEAALLWWKGLNPDNAIPMDKNLNPIITQN